MEGSICQPSPFLYETVDEPTADSIETSFDGEVTHIKPSIRANRVVAYLQALKQDYELPEIAFSDNSEEEESEVVESVVSASDENVSSFPTWLTAQMVSGKEIYMKAAPGGGLCYTCHQPNGKGIPGQFPPLAGSDWVLGDKERLIKISIHGLMGEIVVNGVKYNNVMAPPGIPPGSLTDEQISDVLTYIRNEWGNSAAAVSPSEVASVRSTVQDRAPMQMWTAAELEKESSSD